MEGNPFSSFCVPCAERGRPNVPAMHEVSGEGFCHNCFRGGNGPKSAPNHQVKPGPIPGKARTLALRTQRTVSIVNDYREGLRIVDICLKHRCNPAMVIRAAKDAQLALRHMTAASINTGELTRDYLAGQPYRELTRRYGIPASTIIRRLRRAGIAPNRHKNA